MIVLIDGYNAHNFSHFAHRGQAVAGVRGWPFKAMHGAGPASTFT